jgi:hypothetical protein
LLFCFKTSSNTKLTFYVSLWIWITNYVFLIVYIFIIPLELYMPGSTIKLMHLLKVGNQQFFNFVSLIQFTFSKYMK